MLGDVLFCGVNDEQRVCFGLFAGFSPSCDSMSSENATNRLWVFCLEFGNVET